MVKIVPTIGRVVHYFPSEQDRCEGMDILSEAPCTALVAYVHSDTSVNLAVFDHCGTEWQRRAVPINIERFTGTPRAEWMAFQQGQAAKYAADPLPQVPAGNPDVLAGGRAS